ncbi:MAG: hydrogenase maturation nickel metallochaperone HypA [Sporichthyaceae bacterium]
MHEIGYCDGVLEAVERRAAGRRVVRIGVRIGALHRVVPDAFEQSFQHVAAGGVAEGASTELTTVPARASCRLCGTTFEALETLPDCPSCNSPVLELEGGDEVVLEWVEYHPDQNDPSLQPALPVHAHDVGHLHGGGGDDHVPGHSR